MMKRKLLLILMLIIPLAVSSVLVDAKPINFRATLAQELPEVETQGRGQAIFQVSAEGSSISYRLIVANISDVTMAHIHVSEEPGGNGPPVVWLYPSSPPPALISGRFQGTLSSGSFTKNDFVGPLAGDDIADLITAIHENRAYVNVHTDLYPGGEIRGNLH